MTSSPERAAPCIFRCLGRAPETRFLVTSDAMKSALEPTGFKVVAWGDRTQAAVDWFAEQAEGPRRCPGPRFHRHRRSACLSP